MSGHLFRAVWPVITGPKGPELTDDELLEDAAINIRQVASRHRTRITGNGRGWILPGRTIPGFEAHAQVVVIEAPAEAISQREYHPAA